MHEKTYNQKYTVCPVVVFAHLDSLAVTVTTLLSCGEGHQEPFMTLNPIFSHIFSLIERSSTPEGTY